MNKTLFVDSDVVLDLLCRREPFYDQAARLFTLADRKEISLYTSPVAFANVFYILRKSVGIEKAKELLRKLRLILGVASVQEKVIDLALNSSFTDFEDGIQYFTAKENAIYTFITRNVADYKERDLLIQRPDEFLNAFKLNP